MSNLVLTTSYRRPGIVLDPRRTEAYETGDGWKKTEEMGGRERWIAEMSWDTLLGMTQVSFLKSDQFQEAEAHPKRQIQGNGTSLRKHWTKFAPSERSHSYQRGWKVGSPRCSSGKKGHSTLVPSWMKRERFEREREPPRAPAMASDSSRGRRGRSPYPRSKGYRAAFYRISTRHGRAGKRGGSVAEGGKRLTRFFSLICRTG